MTGGAFGETYEDSCSYRLTFNRRAWLRLFEIRRYQQKRQFKRRKASARNKADAVGDAQARGHTVGAGIHRSVKEVSW